MSPARSKEHLAFVRSLPCCVSGRTFGVEAAHVGSHGMGQKSSDFDTIPLNALFHREQHRIGLKVFCRIYDLDIPAILAMLRQKPRVVIWERRYVGYWYAHTLILGYVEQGWEHSFRLLKDGVREILTEEIQSRVRRRRYQAS